MTLPRERLAYSSPFTRPPLKLPGNGRMIVWTVVNVEEWEITRPMARQLSQPPMGQTPIPDMPNWTWYEYGMRVGFWRLIRALERRGRRPDHVDQRQGLRNLSGGRRARPATRDGNSWRTATCRCRSSRSRTSGR